MRAKFVNEAISDVLKPKSQADILEDLGNMLKDQVKSVKNETNIYTIRRGFLENIDVFLQMIILERISNALNVEIERKDFSPRASNWGPAGSYMGPQTSKFLIGEIMVNDEYKIWIGLNKARDTLTGVVLKKDEFRSGENISSSQDTSKFIKNLKTALNSLTTDKPVLTIKKAAGSWPKRTMYVLSKDDKEIDRKWSFNPEYDENKKPEDTVHYVKNYTEFLKLNNLTKNDVTIRKL